MPQKKTILITGCSDGGLGSALASAFHEAGWRVFASARNPSKLKNAQAAGIETIQLDVLSDESVADAVAKIKELTGGTLDALFNNAGAGYSLPLMDLDIKKTHELFELNVFSLIRVTRAFLPLLIKSHGMVVNNTSVASQLTGGVPFQGAYNASKAAATSMTDVLRLELAPFGVRVINLLTGSVQTNFFENAPTPVLPPNSLYNVAKKAIEEAMIGASMSGASDPNQWARQVVKDLTRSSPAHWIWRGKFATQVRITSWFPVGYFDGPLKQLSNLNILEQKIKEQGGPEKIKVT
ncbi:putative estradiol 17 beta-dehydrogenase [Daldinia caldariorum]|uniref:putative estradiol 17 beta-dehydrogenase n=1 Tax=Daldinia caldariorum TaxID=326644 RepID=UPI002007DA31|nr:putative estradiol 17 beta-dehydrogenase [Daldinia caldariorum]KAI1470851.1 putative estradiol 17 beta-dehydrogenase [Daldinia caldariorum]